MCPLPAAGRSTLKQHSRARRSTMRFARVLFLPLYLYRQRRKSAENASCAVTACLNARSKARPAMRPRAPRSGTRPPQPPKNHQKPTPKPPKSGAWALFHSYTGLRMIVTKVTKVIKVTRLFRRSPAQAARFDTSAPSARGRRRCRAGCLEQGCRSVRLCIRSCFSRERCLRSGGFCS